MSYARIAELAETRLELARVGDWTGLHASDDERAALVHDAGSPRPADREALVRALVAESQLASLAEAGMADTRRELGRLQRGRGAVRGYGQLAAARPAGALA